MTGLDRPRSGDELYLARGAEVEPYRPIITGDVFRGVSVPGTDDDSGLAIVLAHPCAMREGAHLRSHVQMAVVRRGPPIPLDRWDGTYGAMPLPELRHAGDLRDRAVFELAGRVATRQLSLDQRVACLAPMGILLLLQRMTFNMTRYAPDLDTLLESIEYVLDEADLLEEWMAARLAVAGNGDGDLEARIRDEEPAFDAVLRQGVNGSTLRDGLRDPKSRAAVRRAVRAAMTV